MHTCASKEIYKNVHRNSSCNGQKSRNNQMLITSRMNKFHVMKYRMKMNEVLLHVKYLKLTNLMLNINSWTHKNTHNYK